MQLSLLDTERRFLLDNNVILELVRRTFPVSRFSELHARLDEMIRAGRVASVLEVLREIEFHSAGEHDAVLTWCRTREGMFIPPDAGVDLQMPATSVQFSRDLERAMSPVADPFLIAQALAHGDVIVTTESTAPNANAAKIPQVAAMLGAECIDIWNFLRALDLLDLARPIGTNQRMP